MSFFRLLIADGDHVFRNALADLLARQGFQVRVASTLNEVYQQLEESWFHLIILNMQMRDHSDPDDTSGLEILKEENFQPIPKFVIADHPTVAMTREVLRLGANGMPMAIDFFGKEGDATDLLDPIQDIITKHVRVNWDLRIRNREGLSFLQLAQIIEPALSNLLLAERADELENLFRRAFFGDTRQITLERILFHRLGYAVIELTVHASEVHTLLVACGKANSTNMDRRMPENLDHLEWQDSYSTLHFTIQVYRLCYAAPLRTFREILTASNIPKVTVALDSLITQTLSKWHDSQRVFEPAAEIEPLILVYLGLQLEPLDTIIAGICSIARTNGIAQATCNKHRINLQLLEGESFTFPNPASVVGLGSFAIPSSLITCGLIHGHISGATILLDAEGQSWLIDRSRIGTAPILLDYVALEMVIRLEGMDGIDLPHRLYFEQMLEDPAENSYSLPAQLAELLDVTQFIRNAANIDPTAYAIGLFYTTLSYLSTYQFQIEYTRPELTTFVHLLALAARLSERLMASSQLPQQALESLWINPETKDVWVEGRRIELTPQDLAILTYLYQNAGHRYSKQQIMNNVLGHHTDATINDESLFYSAMSRLRLKIERDSKNRKYLHNERGFGYWLDV